MKPAIRILLAFFAVILVLIAAPMAQAQQEVPMADLFYQEGKIYVVVAVMTVLFLGIVLYLLLMEKRLKKLEQKLKDK